MNEDRDQIEKHKEEISAMLDKATPEQIERLYYFISMFVK